MSRSKIINWIKKIRHSLKTPLSDYELNKELDASIKRVHVRYIRVYTYMIRRGYATLEDIKKEKDRDEVRQILSSKYYIA